MYLIYILDLFSSPSEASCRSRHGSVAVSVRLVEVDVAVRLTELVVVYVDVELVSVTEAGASRLESFACP